MKWLPNFITSIRLFGTILLLAINPSSVQFYIVYSLCGITDVLDGFTARALKATSDFGSKLDSIADIVFYSVMLIKLLPQLVNLLPKWIWIWVVVIILIRVISYYKAYKNEHTFSSLHLIMNKVTGVCVFVIPYFLGTSFFYIYGIIVCIVATFASVHELMIHLKKNYT